MIAITMMLMMVVTVNDKCIDSETLTACTQFVISLLSSHDFTKLLL